MIKTPLATAALLLALTVQTFALVEMKNAYLKIVGDPESGRFIIKTTGGDPDLTTDKNKLLLYEEYPPTTFTTIKIDGIDNIFGSDAGQFTVPVTIQNNAMVCTWAMNNIEITMLLEFVTGPNTGRPDSVKISYMANNKDFKAHTVGFRILLDTLLGGNDGSPYRIPGVGEISTETSFLKDRVPEYWYAFDDLSNPTIRAQGTLKSEGLTPPDMVVFASWARFSKAYWDFPIVDGRTFRRNVVGPLDSATANYWNPVNIEPGGKTGVSMMYGLYGATLFKGETFNVSLGGPISTKGEPVAITADIQKTVLPPATNVRAVITLPEGLVLYNNDPAEKKIGTIKSNSSVAKVKWDLVPDGKVKGQVEYKITVTGIIEGKEYTTTISRKLTIDMEAKRPPDLVQPKTNRPPPPPPPPPPPEIKLTTSTRYYFDFSRINEVLASINRDLEKNDSILALINQMLSAKIRKYDSKMRDEHNRTIRDIGTNFPGYSTRIQDAGRDVIHSQTVTNKAQ